MKINELLVQKGITKYRIAKSSGIPQTNALTKENTDSVQPTLKQRSKDEAERY